MLSALPAQANEVRVKNTGDAPIYNLYIWPSDLIPSSNSVITFPIGVGDTEKVKIDNSWSDCVFTFQIDRNDPTDLDRFGYIKLPMNIVEYDICKSDRKPLPLPQAD